MHPLPSAAAAPAAAAPKRACMAGLRHSQATKQASKRKLYTAAQPGSAQRHGPPPTALLRQPAPRPAAGSSQRRTSMSAEAAAAAGAPPPLPLPAAAGLPPIPPSRSVSSFASEAELEEDVAMYAGLPLGSASSVVLDNGGSETLKGAALTAGRRRYLCYFMHRCASHGGLVLRHGRLAAGCAAGRAGV